MVRECTASGVASFVAFLTVTSETYLVRLSQLVISIQITNDSIDSSVMLQMALVMAISYDDALVDSSSSQVPIVIRAIALCERMLISILEITLSCALLFLYASDHLPLYFSLYLLGLIASACFTFFANLLLFCIMLYEDQKDLEHQIPFHKAWGRAYKHWNVKISKFTVNQEHYGDQLEDNGHPKELRIFRWSALLVSSLVGFLTNLVGYYAVIFVALALPESQQGVCMGLNIALILLVVFEYVVDRSDIIGEIKSIMLVSNICTILVNVLELVVVYFLLSGEFCGGLDFYFVLFLRIIWWQTIASLTLFAIVMVMSLVIPKKSWLHEYRLFRLKFSGEAGDTFLANLPRCLVHGHDFRVCTSTIN